MAGGGSAGDRLHPADPGADPGVDPSAAPPSSSTPTPTSTTTPTEAPDPGPRPKVGECHALSFRQAVAVFARTEPVACRGKHTAQTYFVGRLNLTTPAGRTRLPDSVAAQRQARTTCTSRLAGHLGREPRELRLSMARAVWFTPSRKRAAAGAGWFRCDVVAVASPRKLLQLPARTKGWGAAPAAAMCATAAPGTQAFRRVSCGAPHAWLAVSTVDIAGAKLPPQGAIAEQMDRAVATRPGHAPKTRSTSAGHRRSRRRISGPRVSTTGSAGCPPDRESGSGLGHPLSCELVGEDLPGDPEGRVGVGDAAVDGGLQQQLLDLLDASRRWCARRAGASRAPRGGRGRPAR